MKLTKIAIALVPEDFSKQLTRQTALGLAVLLGILCCSPVGVQANEEEPVRQGLPGRRISGASRLPTSACAQTTTPLVAIVPETNLGTTAVAKPTLWLSVPEVRSAKQLDFYLFNTQEEIIYQTSLIVKPTADILGLDLSTMANAPNLEVNQRYRWAASMVCNPDNHSENIAVEGWVDRVESAAVESNQPWYDQLGLLMEQLQRYPQNQDVLSQWYTLMASARLDQIVPLSIHGSSVEIALPTRTIITN
ncbi:hypothetical protein N836_28950 [Leptolyngbya sp. Heron Island J]|uniref:DUF928 domain-containing protein n=1 Tax=Leptolyngbya sp. Heron Island J TaxID=1385935 RepID=UPI0003B97947|nr:DUF928 domain-containing protein [Leptolyngbya sp. Heron Island J]ESA39107.1 hypothetical protein N836_28950 [Leptolyngbya sp. Heron Island J]